MAYGVQGEDGSRFMLSLRHAMLLCSFPRLCLSRNGGVND